MGLTKTNMVNTTKFDEKILMGSHNGEKVEYLAPPSWDCDWYWGFGYLQSENIHHHIDGLNKNKNMFDAIKEYYGDTLNNKLQIDDNKNLWKFCELMATFYALKKTAEVLGRGGSHYTTNPCKEIIKNEAEAKRINYIVMPALFDEIYKIFKD